MAQDSKIEWTHHTANLWWGCAEVHAGCDNCYAKAWAKRYQPTELWGKASSRMAIKGVWNDLLKYQRNAAAKGEIHRVFVGSMMDIFEKNYAVVDRNADPIDSQHYEDEYMDLDELRMRFFSEIIPNSPNLIFLLLTKRPSNINKIIPASWLTQPPANVMFGTSVVNAATYGTLVPQLLNVKGKRFLSIEPQLDGIYVPELEGIDWVIQGGESGPRKRPFDLKWARHMRDECAKAGVPYFFKQIDKVQAIPADLQVRQFPIMQAA